MKRAVKETITRVDRQLVSLTKDHSKLRYGGPVFIIGPPRSGTTLAYQLLTACFSFGYITNSEAKRPYAPGIASVMAQISGLGGRKAERFSSEYGRTPGRFGPHEAGQFWYRWFPAGEDVYARAGDLGPECIQEMRKYLSFLEAVKRKPLVFKNVYHSARIGILREVFPEAVFLIVRRAPLEVAQSILRAREKTGAGRDEWWSLPPPYGVPSDMAWPEQIISQVIDVYCEIDDQCSVSGNDRFCDISYASLCREPETVLRNVEDFFKEKGVHARLLTKPPVSFEPGPERSVSDADYHTLREALAAQNSRREKDQ